MERRHLQAPNGQKTPRRRQGTEHPKREKGSTKRELTIHIDNGQISTANNHALAHDQTKASSTTGNYTDPTLERERSESPLHVEATTTLDGSGGGEHVLLGVLDGNTIICTSE